MAAPKSTRKTVRKNRKNASQPKSLVNFNWEGETYVLDLDRNKVYRNWMAVETNRGFAILGAYRQQASAISA